MAAASTFTSISGIAFTTTGALAVALALGLSIALARALAPGVTGVILAAAANGAGRDALFQLFEFEIQMFHLIFPFCTTFMLLLVLQHTRAANFAADPCRKSARTSFLARSASELAAESGLNISASLVIGGYARYWWL
jgi:hypothetical protein